MKTRRFRSRSGTAFCASLPALLATIVMAAGPAAAQPAPKELASEPLLEALRSPKKHQKRQSQPIKLGASGGNVGDFGFSGSSLNCCGGTLGGLVEKNGEHFVLSNNHVLAMSNVAKAGDLISHPALLDGGTCPDTPASDVVAELTGFKPIKFDGRKNKVDAAIARVRDGSTSPTGNILQIGEPGNTTAKPKLGMSVQKSGRTTGWTEGEITLVNVTVDVQYFQECTETAPAFLARFVKTFWVESVGSGRFSAGGDSGSFIYENVKRCPRAVGLLFAGGGGVTVANRMSAVLKAADKMQPRGKARLVGCDPVATAASAFSAQRALSGLEERELTIAQRVQKRMEARILDLPGVHAMGIGRSRSQPGEPVFRVYAESTSPETLAEIPRRIDGIEVEVFEQPRLVAYGCPAPTVATVD